MDRENYWVQKEAEIGEPVEIKFYCTYISGDLDVKGPLTGVLFFSKSTLYFQSFHSSKSLATLFQMRREEGISEGHAFQMPLKDIRCSYKESPKIFWRSLFAEPEQPFVIHLTGGERETGSYRFSVDRKKLKTIASLINSNRSIRRSSLMKKENDIRWEQRFANYLKALAQLQKFIAKGELSELEKQGLIKAFEYTYELAWKTLKDFLEFSGQTDIYGSRDVTRKAFELNLIEDGEGWMDMLQSRNLTSHTYREEVAEEICRQITELYFSLLTLLKAKLESLHSERDKSDFDKS